MHRIRPSFKLAIALAWLSLTGVMVAQWLGVLPNVQARIMQQRRALCESLAVDYSLLLDAGRPESVQISLDELKLRHGEITSAAARRGDGSLMAQTPEHDRIWKAKSPPKAVDTKFSSPLRVGEKRLGELEIAFQPISETWLFGFIDRASAQSLILIAAINLLLFGSLLWKALYEFDPSKAAPSNLRAAFDAMAEGLLVIDKQGRIAIVNESLSKAILQPVKQLVGREASILPFEPTKEDSPTWSEITKTAMQIHRIEMILPSASGIPRTFIVNASPILDPDGRRRGVLATFDDITELASRSRELVYMLGMVRESRDKIKEQNDELRVLATRDPLTGCFNRRSFFERFESQWHSQAAGQFAAIMVDIDHFKSVNDNHGHATGDQVLRGVAQALQQAASEADVVCRYGGEEFAILTSARTVAEAEAAAETLRTRISELTFGELRVTASLGISHVAFAAETPQELLEQADKALYHSKRSGRNRVSRFDQLPPDFTVGQTARAEGGGRSRAADESLKAPYHAVASLLAALAYRDPETAAHSMRVADLAVAAARGLMSAGDAYLLEIGALLHDAGKIGVPDAVLLKPGPLSKEEWRVMQSHDRMGVEIVSASFTCPELTEIIRCHHAWYGQSKRDGALPTGEAIPLRARLIAIADAYDAMVSDRVYRKGRSQAEAFEELRKMAPLQFDPALVERFIQVVSQRAPRQEQAGALDKDVTLHLCMQTERMARAVDDRDFSAIRALAQHLELTAAKCDFAVMRELAAEIGRLAEDSTELPQLVELMHDLMELCLATQKACLTQCSVNSPRE